MKFIKNGLYYGLVILLFRILDSFLSHTIWPLVQKNYAIPRGIIFTIDSYVPHIIAFILAITFSCWLYSIWKWNTSCDTFSETQEKQDQQKTSILELPQSRLETKEQSMGKQYVIQLTEEELLQFWSTLQDLENNLEEKVSFDFPSSHLNILTVHLIGGKKKKLKKWGQNILFLLFVFGALTGIFLVLAEIWNLITST